MPKLPELTLVPALRIVVDFDVEEDERRVDVTGVRLAMFGRPGRRFMRASLQGKPETSWFFPLEQDVPVDPHAALSDDPTHLDVFYLCSKDEQASQRRDKVATRGETVEVFILQTLTNLAKIVQAPEPPKFNENLIVRKMHAKSQRQKRSFMYGFSREVYFFHLLRNFYMPAFLRLLDDVVESSSCSSSFSPDLTFEQEFLDGNETKSGKKRKSKPKSKRKSKSKFNPKPKPRSKWTAKSTNLWVSWHSVEFAR